MAWREEIADRAQSGDTDGVLKIFDELWADRERVRGLNVAYLEQIAELKGGGAAVVARPGQAIKATDEAAFIKHVQRFTEAVKRYTAAI